MWGESVRIAMGESIHDDDGIPYFIQTDSMKRYRNWSATIVEWNTGKSGEWPGLPINADWEDTESGFEIEPTLAPDDSGYARVRRFARPGVDGIIVGITSKVEATFSKPEPGDHRSLISPKRVVWFYEVALHPTSGHRSELILAHPNDLVEM